MCGQQAFAEELGIRARADACGKAVKLRFCGTSTDSI